MATYSVLGDDGKKYNLDGPEGMSPQQAKEVLRYKMRDQWAMEQADRELKKAREYDSYDILDEVEEFGKGIPRGAVNIGELAAKGVAGWFDADKETMDYISDVAETARSPFTADQGPGGDTIMGTVGEGLGSIVPMAGMALLGPAGWAAAGATGVAAGSGEAGERARNAGATQEQIDEAELYGSLIGATEAMPLFRILGRAGKDVIEGIVKRYGTAALEEGGQEALSAIAQNLVEQQVYNPDADLVNMEVVKEAGVGGTVGLIVQGLADLALKNKRAPATPDEPALTATPEERAARIREKQATLDAAQGDNFVGPTLPTDGPMPLSEEERQARQDEQDAAYNEMRRFQTMEGFQGPIPEQAGPSRDLYEQDQARKEVKAETAKWRKGKSNAKLLKEVKAERARLQEERLNAANEASAAELDRKLAELEREQARLAGESFQGPMQPQAGAPTREQVDADRARREQDIADAEAIFQGPNLPAQGPQRLEDMLAEREATDRQQAEANQQFQGPNLPAQGPRQIPKVQADVIRQATGLANRQANALPAPDPLDPRQNAERKAVDIRARAEERQRQKREQAPSILQSVLNARKQAQRDADTARLEGGSRQQTMEGIGRQQPTPEVETQQQAPTRNITAKRLDTAGVPPNAPIRKRIVGKNLSDPEQLAYVREQLRGFANNPSVSANAKAGVNRLINELNTKQPDLFETPRRKPDAKKPQSPAAPSTPDDQGLGTSPTDMQPDTMVGGAGTDVTDTTQFIDSNRGGLGQGDGVPSGPRRRTNERGRALAQEPVQVQEEAPTPAPTPAQPPKQKQKAKPQDRKKTIKEAAEKVKEEGKRRRRTQFGPRESERTDAQRRADAAREQDRKMREMNDAALREFFAEQSAKEEAKTEKDENYAQRKARVNADSDAWFEQLVAEKGTEAFGGYNVDYNNAVLNDPTSLDDMLKIFVLRSTDKLRQKGSADVNARARKMFETKRRPIDVLNTIAYDLVNPKEAADMDAAIAAEAWINANLSNAAKQHIENFKRYYTWLNNKAKDTAKARKARAERDARRKQAQLEEDFSTAIQLHGATYKETDADREADDITRGLAQLEDIMEHLNRASAKRDTQLGAVAETLHPDAIELLNNGDLAGALNVLAKRGANRFIRNASKKLAQNVGATKVRVVDNIGKYVPNAVDSNGNAVAGYYVATNSPQNTGDYTNTIFIASDSLNGLTLLHEMVHAATVKEIAMMRTPAAKKLRTLFDQVRNDTVLEGEYGADGLNRKDFDSDEQYNTAQFLEFVAEAYSNPVFQNKLAKVSLDKFGKVTAADRFWLGAANVVRRLLGLPTKEIFDPVKVELDAMIEAIMAPAPRHFKEASVLPEGSARSKRDPDEIAKNLAKEISGNILREYTPSRGIFIRNMIDKLPTLARKAMLYVQPLNAVADMAKKWPSLAPVAQKLDRLTREQSGALNNRNAQNEVVVKQVGNWKAKHGKTHGRLLNTLIAESTLAEVDPTLTLAQAQKKYRIKLGKDNYAPDREKMDAWRAMQGALQELKTVGGDKVYVTMRDTYSQYGKQIEKLISGHIDAVATDEDGVTNERLAKQLRAAIDKVSRIEPYFPLERKGDFWIYFKDKAGKEYVEAYETKAERAEAIKQLKTEAEVDGASISEYMRAQINSMEKVPPTEFFLNVKQALDTNNASPEMKREVAELFLKAMPEQSFMRSFVKRKGTPGFHTDMIDVFGRKTAGLARQLTQMEYGSKLAEVQRELTGLTGRTAPDDIRNVEGADDFIYSLRKSAQYARSPNVGRISKALTAGGFHMTLGLNASAAIINMSQLPMVTAPYLGATYGIKNSFSALGTASRLFAGSGRDRVIEVPQADGSTKKYTTKAFPGLDNHDYKAMAEKARKAGDKETAQLAEDMQVLVDIASREGQLNRSIAYDILDLDNTEGMGNKINAISGWMFHHAERFNRQVGLAMAYKLEVDSIREKAAKEKRQVTQAELEAAAQQAIDVVELTNGSANAASAPRIAHNDVGRVAFLFKRYGVTMIYMLSKLAKNAVYGKDKALAAKQLGYITAGSAALAGVHGLPMFGVLGTLYDLFLQDEDEDDWDTMVRKATGELAFNGGINALTGWSAGSRMGLSDLIFRDPYMNDDKMFLQSALEQIGGPVLSLAFGMERGARKILDGQVQTGFEQMLPAAMRNPLKTLRYADEGALTARKDPIVEDFDAMELVGQLAGFAPSRYQLQSAINTRNARVQKALSKQSTDLRKKLYIATRIGDVDAYIDILNDINEYNAKHPEAKITLDSIKRSLRSHAKTSALMRGGVTINPRLAAQIAQSDEEFSRTLTVWDML